MLLCGSNKTCLLSQCPSIIPHQVWVLGAKRKTHKDGVLCTVPLTQDPGEGREASIHRKQPSMGTHLLSEIASVWAAPWLRTSPAGNRHLSRGIVRINRKCRHLGKSSKLLRYHATEANANRDGSPHSRHPHAVTCWSLREQGAGWISVLQFPPCAVSSQHTEPWPSS